MRGPATVPSRMASRRATSTNARKVPTSRTVVNPANRVARALPTPLSASWAALRSIAGTPDPWSSPTRWVWQSISPGSSVWPGSSTRAAPSGRGRAEPALDPLPPDQHHPAGPHLPGLDVDHPVGPHRDQPTVPRHPASLCRPPPMMTHRDFPLDRSIRRIRSPSQSRTIRQQTMRTRTPRHLAEHRLPYRLMLVAFGLTFAVLAAVVASAALVPQVPSVPTVVEALPTGTAAAPATAGPAPTVSPSSSGPERTST